VTSFGINMATELIKGRASTVEEHDAFLWFRRQSFKRGRPAHDDGERTRIHSEDGRSSIVLAF
jgi:hypothetical protein